MDMTQDFLKSHIVTNILDGKNCPVAIMRLFSDGIQINNRIVRNDFVSGDKGCLACGNCVDACPVVREKRRFVFIMNQRTSMSLENIVGDECRRCFACVYACPQVGKHVKELVNGFRRGEKIVHAAVATLIIFLAATGIFMYHYSEHIPEWQQVTFRLSHTVAGIALIFMPFLYYVLDKNHFKRMLVNSFRFGSADWEWLKNFWAFLKHPIRRPLPNWSEFNTYHKFWVAYLTVTIPILGATGFINLFLWDGSGLSFSLHAIFALSVDLLVFIHIYFKILRHIVRNMADLKNCMKENKNIHYPFLYDPYAKKSSD